MLRKTRLTLYASALLGAAAMAPNAALAFFPPPPPGGLGGPPPLAHLGPPPMAHLGGPPHLGGLPHARLGGPAGRSAGLSRFGGRAAGSGYGRSAHSGYGRGEWRHRYGRYGAYVSGSDGSSSDDGCSSTYTSSGRRVTVCDEN